MKKINLILLVIAINLGVYAQSPYGTGRMNSDSISSSSLNIPNGFIKKNGKTVKVEDGKLSVLKKDFTLSDGTVVKTNGSFKSKDGTETNLKDGDHLDLNGKLTTMDNSKINNDSARTNNSNSNGNYQNNNMNDNNNQVK